MRKICLKVTPRGKYVDLLPALPLNNCILDYEEENVMIEIPDYRSIYTKLFI
jgi:hypothetical protein